MKLFDVNGLFQLSCVNYTFLPYIYECGPCVITNAAKESTENKQSLMLRFKKLLKDVEIQSKYVISPTPHHRQYG